MSVSNFRHSPLPAPTEEYDAEQQRQLLRALELYFSQLDSDRVARQTLIQRYIMLNSNQ